MKNNKKKKHIIILLLLLLSLSVGFALLQANLKINGSSKIQGSSWDIHFENLNVTNGSVALSTGDVGATIQSSRTDITYTVTLNLPGDYYEFTVDAVNAGTVDGMVESVTSKLNNQPITSLPSYLNFSVTYETNDTIEINHLLKAGNSETYKVRIEYKRDITSTDMPTTAINLTLSFGVIYVQADSNGVEIEHPLNGIIYTLNKYDANITGYNRVVLNQEFPKSIPYYKTQNEVINVITNTSGSNIPVYLKHKVENGIVTEQYVEFVVTEAVAQANSGMLAGTYDIRGEKTKDGGQYIVDENYISQYYESNKEIIKSAYGYETDPSRCREDGTGNSKTFFCMISSMSTITDVIGGTYSYDASNSGCYVLADGYALCR